MSQLYFLKVFIFLINGIKVCGVKRLKTHVQEIGNSQVLSYGRLIVINLLWREQVASQLSLFTKLIIGSLSSQSMLGEGNYNWIKFELLTLDFLSRWMEKNCTIDKEITKQLLNTRITPRWLWRPSRRFTVKIKPEKELETPHFPQWFAWFLSLCTLRKLIFYTRSTMSKSIIISSTNCKYSQFMGFDWSLVPCTAQLSLFSPTMIIWNHLTQKWIQMLFLKARASHTFGEQAEAFQSYVDTHSPSCRGVYGFGPFLAMHFVVQFN